MNLAQEIRQYALELGFNRVGFTTADPFPLLTRELEERSPMYHWVKEGPLQLGRIADPGNVLPGAGSLVVLIWDYYREAFPPSLVGKVGKAYLTGKFLTGGRTLREMVKMMIGFMEEKGMKVGMRPAMPDRQAASRAGLGKFGRNTFIYVPGAGSYISITCLAVDRELDGEVHEPETACPEDCRKCMEACPTGALYEPFRMNPLKCIAFHTYATGNFPDTPADIPEEIREKMGTWVYGCDECQDVCPQNGKKLKEGLPASPYLEDFAARVTLPQLLRMDEDFYLRVVQPLLRGYIRDRKFFQRNAAIALANTGDSNAVPILEEALNSPEEMVRHYAGWAIQKIRDRSK